MTKIVHVVALLLCTSFSCNIYAQVTRQTIIGTWICREATTPKPDPIDNQMREILQNVKTGFTNAEFSFRDNGIFNLQFPANAPKVIDDLKSMDNHKWSLDANRSIISIGNNLMQIKVKQEGAFLIFSLMETPLTLKMEKR